MTFFRILLAILTINIIGYTLIVGMYHGWDLVPIFFRDIAAMTWPGQFNMDFASFLILSGSWVMWRNEFSPAGIALGLVAFFGGILFLGIYLLVLSFQCADLREILLGQARATA